MLNSVNDTSPIIQTGRLASAATLVPEVRGYAAAYPSDVRSSPCEVGLTAHTSETARARQKRQRSAVLLASAGADNLTSPQ